MKKAASGLLHNVIKGIIILIAILLIFHLIIENSSIYYKSRNIIWRRNYFMHLNAYDLYLIKGEEFHLKLHAINKRVTFSSTDFRVAPVYLHGRIRALQPGKCFILAKVDNKVLKCRVHVMEINKEKMTLKVGRSKRLRIRGVSSFVKWDSSNPRVASVSIFGTVKAKKKGNAIIYGTVKGKTLKCVVRVK